ncbi:MAG: HEAT repeat domain-containing protein [Vicinamibacteria bacterium]|nr:HEAT repeat domain-containing protein [Vicinamibacteria bacterium]
MPIVASRTGELGDLLERLGGADAVLRDAAAARLLLVGRRALAPLLTWLPTASTSGREAAAGLLEQLPGASALQALIELLEDPSDAVAARAAEALAARNDAAGALPALERALGRRSPVPRTALAALGRIAGDQPEALGPITRLALDPTAAHELSHAALGVLKRLAPREATAVETEMRARRAAAAAPPATEVGARPAEPPAAASPTETATEAVGELAELRMALREPVSPERAVRAEQLATALGARALDVAREVALASHDPLALRVAIDALALAPRADAAPRLLDLLARLAFEDVPAQDARAELAARAHRALGRLGSRLALHDLRDRLRVRPPVALPFLLGAVTALPDVSLLEPLAELMADGLEPADELRAAANHLATTLQLTTRSRAVTSLPDAPRTALRQALLRPRVRRASPRSSSEEPPA